MHLVAIDVGVKNLGICVYDYRSREFVLWDNVSLLRCTLPRGYMPTSTYLVHAVHEFVRKHDRYFAGAWQVVVEKQMFGSPRVVEAILHTLCYDRCTVVPARAVKLHFGTGTKTYADNKRKAVECAERYADANADRFADGLLTTFNTAKKRDDMADALLLAVYYTLTYSDPPTGDA